MHYYEYKIVSVETPLTEERLNEFGVDRWELVFCEMTSEIKVPYYIFKRTRNK